MKKAIIKKPSITETLNQLQESGDFVIFDRKNFNMESIRTLSYSWARRTGIKVRVYIDNYVTIVKRL